jgi:transposase
MSNTPKVHNWKDYNRSLVKRGEILLNFDENFLSELYYTDKQARGGIRKFTDKMYEYLLTIKVVLRIPWRTTIGFAKSILKKAFPYKDIEVPDYAHASRTAARLNLKIKQYVPNNIGMEIVFDSTGVNVYTTSGYHQRRYGKNCLCRKRDQWKKIHFAMDLDTKQILSMAYTNSNTNDCVVIKKLCDEIQGKIKSVRADGAYDTEEFFQIIHDWGATALIPPARTSKAQHERKTKRPFKKCLVPRDQIIKTIRNEKSFDEGLKMWKQQSGYHRRSLIETFMFRLKRVFGFNLQHKKDKARVNEIITKINVLNLMASLGLPKYV